jgi:hypothetical protein
MKIHYPNITGSAIALNGFTGSLLGTASYATTASFALNGGSGGNFVTSSWTGSSTSQFSGTASLALTSSRLNAANTSIFAASSNRMVITASNGIIMDAGNVGLSIESGFFVSGSVRFGSLVTSSTTTNVLTYDTSTQQVYFTASSAIGRGSSISTSSFIGNGLSSSFNINHGFNTRNLHITVYDSASGDIVYPDLRHTNANTSSIIFANPPLANQYVVYISQ